MIDDSNVGRLIGRDSGALQRSVSQFEVCGGISELTSSECAGLGLRCT